ncbi:mce-family protein mce1f [Mycolicibacterium conceptionense]|uniref:Mce-family protein mce1f n=1 Tax=Mycolicibacterium conceptionense TaxID=451644 RepID=A0A0U1DWX7_9MYCO|nr:mce-family protein mce1f [Mycolicibacterium conceptionense]
MLTRFIRTQLILFTVASVVGVAVMLFAYMQVPTLLGIGRITVKLELPATGGLYQFSNVTYRGSQIGKVTSVELTEKGAEATLSLDRSPKVPADLAAEVRSMSAVGEQYVELLPRTNSGPYLENGSVISVSDTKIPQQVGPMLDQLSALVDTIPKDKLSQLLDESYNAFNGTGYDFGSLLDSASTVTRDSNAISDQTRALIDDGRPFLDAQAQTTDSIRTWAASVAGITGQVAENDPEIRSLLRNGPGFAQETTKLLDQIKPTLPILLANLTTFGQIAVTYNPSIEQLLVLLPPYVAQLQTYAHTNNTSGLPMADFSLGLGDPPTCTVGFLPPSAWRSPADTTVIDTPDDIYCKLPQDSPIASAVHATTRVWPIRASGAHGRIVRRSKGIPAARAASACAGPVSSRPQPDRPGHPPGLAGAAGREDLHGPPRRYPVAAGDVASATGCPVCHRRRPVTPTRFRCLRRICRKPPSCRRFRTVKGYFPMPRSFPCPRSPPWRRARSRVVPEMGPRWRSPSTTRARVSTWAAMATSTSRRTWCPRPRRGRT